MRHCRCDRIGPPAITLGKGSWGTGGGMREEVWGGSGHGAQVSSNISMCTARAEEMIAAIAHAGKQGRK